MKVRVKKDALGGEDEQTIFGQTAEAGDWVEVDDKLADKIKGNPTLEAQGARASRVSSSDDDAAAKEAAEKKAADDAAKAAIVPPARPIGSRA